MHLVFPVIQLILRSNEAKSSLHNYQQVDLPDCNTAIITGLHCKSKKTEDC
jgi:hypothetical protein